MRRQPPLGYRRTDEKSMVILSSLGTCCRHFTPARSNNLLDAFMLVVSWYCVVRFWFRVFRFVVGRWLVCDATSCATVRLSYTPYVQKSKFLFLCLVYQCFYVFCLVEDLFGLQLSLKKRQSQQSQPMPSTKTKGEYL